MEKLSAAAVKDDNTLTYQCRLINDGFVVENFFREGRSGAIISKKLPIYKYFEEKFGIMNLFLFDLFSEARAFYTNTAQNEFEILQIILEVHETHKEYEKRGGYNRH